MKKRIFWGVMAIFGGAILILHMMGIGAEYSLIPILGSLVLGAVSIENFAHCNFFGGFIPLGIVAYIWRTELRIEEVNPALLIAAMVLLSIGFTAIFRPFRKKRRHGCGRHHADRQSSTFTSENAGVQTGEIIYIESNFGECSRYIRSDNLKLVDLDINFSGAKIYFEDCKVSEEGLTITADVNFSGVTLFVPRHWQIDNKCAAFAGAVENTGVRPPADTVLSSVQLTGEVNFGSIKIIYV